jgi:hypothetical protein
MDIIKTPRAIIDVLDSEGKITGHEIEYHVFPSGEGAEHFSPRLVREPASLEQVQIYRDASADGLAASFAALNTQLAAERVAYEQVIAEKNAVIAEKEAAIGAAVAEASPG